MTGESGTGGAAVFACGLLRDPAGRVLIVQMGTDEQNRPLWWLPGEQILSTGGASETLRVFLTRDLGLRRPQLHGQQLTSGDPTPDAPGGQFMLLFDCGTIRDDEIDRGRLHAGALVQGALWATIAQARALLIRDEFVALVLALKHRPAGIYRHIRSDPATSGTSPGPPAASAPRRDPPDSTVDDPASSGRVMPGISYARDARPELPKRVPNPPGSSHSRSKPIDWFGPDRPPLTGG